jgi:hypothetical protein
MGLLHPLFGPSQSEIWGQHAEQVKGRFDGSGWGNKVVVVQTGNWTLLLDTFTYMNGKSSTVFTRMRAPYVNADNFRFKIYREGFFSPLGRALGMQDIAIGDPEFDRQFVVQGNDETKVKHFFDDDRLKTLLYAESDLSFEVKDDEGYFGGTFPQGVDELFFRRVGIMKNVAELRGLFDLFSYSLHRLCQMGSAYEKDPGLKLWRI